MAKNSEENDSRPRIVGHPNVFVGEVGIGSERLDGDCVADASIVLKRFQNVGTGRYT